jgi:hypothetical protein
MLRLGEEVNCGLAIQEEEIRADRTAGFGCRLGEDDGVSWGSRGTDNVSVGCTPRRLDGFMGLGHDKDTVVVGGNRRIVRGSSHCVNLGRRVALGAVSGDVTLLATSLADDHTNFGATGNRTRRGGGFRRRISLWLTRHRWRRGSILGKDEHFIHLGRRLPTRRGSGRTTRGTG